YLKKFPADNLKIDISFIKGIADDPDDAAMVAAIISMAHTLKLNTISEGVETEDQLEMLRTLQGDLSQGYYHSVPLPPEELGSLLEMEARTELDGVSV
ncbi:MAG: EAL domain-containing protein, partial [Spirochaetia bacterium]